MTTKLQAVVVMLTSAVYALSAILIQALLCMREDATCRFGERFSSAEAIGIVFLALTVYIATVQLVVMVVAALTFMPFHKMNTLSAYGAWIAIGLSPELAACVGGSCAALPSQLLLVETGSALIAASSYVLLRRFLSSLRAAN